MKYAVVLTALSAIGMSACNDGNADEGNQQAIDTLIQKTKDTLVRVEGGSFQMGDFGPIDPNLTGGNKGLPYSAEQDNKPLHKVTLDTFYMLPTKVTYADYDIYTQATGKEKINNTSKYEMRYRQDNVPAGVNWHQAKKYCGWLAEKTSLPFTLPTEAQWEYAARSGGQFIPYGTSTGTLEKGKSIPTSEEVREATNTGDSSGLAPYPVDMYPPNPIGLYQMGDNGYEWVSDWYLHNYYNNSPQKNPRGPDEGNKKVVRGISPGQDWGGKLTMERYHAPPNIGDKFLQAEFSFRCVVNAEID
ncbi:formylglycine-generating enzyme family protein [Cobetia amphilecti]|uniref:formylglycine-generating enzyme family protein n=1 Tax=Cobetia amphilecti TaxID=1055104 RepID=UPI0024474EFF|nr:SUMF1/EgtB/PvdO family nonheme iron enzyme [Cobetia litoralis]MDH2420334.1 SUMF1/EgtB/PvdO family nonheme iron enzyme [Cobetia litoralis]